LAELEKELKAKVFKEYSEQLFTLKKKTLTLLDYEEEFNKIFSNYDDEKIKKDDVYYKIKKDFELKDEKKKKLEDEKKLNYGLGLIETF
jgi:hypothetical protein